VASEVYATGNVNYQKDAASSWTEDCSKVIISEITDLSSNTNDEKTIYPNPATNQITISGDVEEVTIYNNLGISVLHSTSTHVEIGHLQTGIYHVAVNYAKQQFKSYKLLVY
jgi:hypothetical protein